MADLSNDDVLKLARLARLDLSDDEVNSLAGELTEILHYVEMLQNVDVAGLNPTNQVSGLQNVTRQDTVQDYGYTPSQLLSGVPHTRDNQIQVKRMLG